MDDQKRIDPELIDQAKALIQPETRQVCLAQLQHELGVTFFAALDIRNELEREGLAIIPRKNEQISRKRYRTKKTSGTTIKEKGTA